MVSLVFHFSGICRYFENHASYFVLKPKEEDPIKLISLRQISLSIALKYIIINSV